MNDRKNIALTEKWGKILDSRDEVRIHNPYKRQVTAILLENQLNDLSANKKTIDPLMEDTVSGNVSGITDNIFGAVPSGTSPLANGSAVGNGYMAGYDPILIKLVRRSVPQLLAFDVCGVQPMTQPTGLIFAMKSRYKTMDGREALYNEADSSWSTKGKVSGKTSAHPAEGDGEAKGSNWAEAIEAETDEKGYPKIKVEDYGFARGTKTIVGEVDDKWNEMAMSIERTSVTARSRYLQAEYTMELAQDLKTVHGLDAASELSNILATEIVSEINREIIRDIYLTATWGCADTKQKGIFDLDLDSGGRWANEKYKGLLFRIEREANAVGHMTRRGRGNFILCSADVASALQMTGALEYAPALKTDLHVDDTSTTFAGVLNGKYKVYIDPYTGNFGSSQYFVVGYKGDSPYDAGLFYCPYVPLQMVKAIDPDTFQPKIGFKTRYGIAFNPMVQLDANIKVTGEVPIMQMLNKNYYYRKCIVQNLQ